MHLLLNNVISWKIDMGHGSVAGKSKVLMSHSDSIDSSFRFYWFRIVDTLSNQLRPQNVVFGEIPESGKGKQEEQQRRDAMMNGDPAPARQGTASKPDMQSTGRSPTRERRRKQVATAVGQKFATHTFDIRAINLTLKANF